MYGTGTAMMEDTRLPIEDESMIDAQRLGAIIRGARHRARYVDMSDLVGAMQRKTGMRWHEHTLYTVEQGKRLPNLNMLLALMVTLDLTMDELVSAVHEESREAVRKLLR